MRKVKVITDSCADISAELLNKYDLDYAKMSTHCDGVESPARLEWTWDEIHAFYQSIRDGKRITTSQVSVEEFERIFKLYLEQGYDIVYVACSTKQSGSVNTASMVAKRMLADYPDAEIDCIDSKNTSSGEGMLAIEAAKKAAEGMSAAEITKYILSILKTPNEYCTVHSLDQLKRAGRVTASKAFFGNLMGVKPIIIADAVGAQAAYAKAKGRAKSLRMIVDLLKESIVDSENQTLYIAHADCPKEEVEMVRSMMEAEIPCKEIVIGSIGPIVGASVGPDAIAIFGFGKPVTFCGDDK